MQTSFDVIVVGLGAMGSAALYQLAKRGVKTLGIDRYNPPHVYGSTHGETRITRLAIGEGVEYVPLVMRSHELWREIESETGYELLVQCGGLIMAKQDGVGTHHGKYQFLKRTIAAAQEFNIEHEILTADEIKARYPQFNLEGDEEGYYEPAAGFVMPERCVQAQLELAQRRGASVKTNERVLSYNLDSNGTVTVNTDKAIYSAQRLIISAGPYLNQLLKGYEEKFKIYRQVLYWFEVGDSIDLYKPCVMSIFIWMFGDGPDDLFYGFPTVDRKNVKVAREEFQTTCDPEDVKREIAKDEIATMYENFVKGRLNGVSRNCAKAASCLYTVTPDNGFVIDFHPEHKKVIIASPCSGHGFKHSAAIGEALAQRAIQGKSEIDLSKFKFERYDS